MTPALPRRPTTPAAGSSGSARAFGETPHQYLTRRRIDAAKELLSRTPLSVTDVCLDGIEATFKDNSGNWFSLTQPRG